MPLPTLTAPPTPAPNKYGQDPVVFDAAMQARLDWQATNTAQETVLVTWINDQASAVDADAAAALASKTLAEAAASNPAVQNAASNAASATTSAMNAANASAATAANASAAASSASAASAQVLALGVVLSQGIGAMSVNASGELVASWNEPTVTSMAINASGELQVTYP